MPTTALQIIALKVSLQKIHHNRNVFISLPAVRCKGNAQQLLKHQPRPEASATTKTNVSTSLNMPSLTQLAFAILLCLSCAFAAPIDPQKRNPVPLNWGGCGSNGDGLGSLGDWIFGDKFPVKRDDNNLNKRDPARVKWGSFGSDGDGLGSLGGWIFGNKFPVRRSPTAAEVKA